MIENKTYFYGKDDGKKGLEARAKRKGTTVYIEIEGSNIFVDYLTAFFGAWPRVKPFPGLPFKFHRVWWRDTKEFSIRLKHDMWRDDIQTFKIQGQSAGGSQALYLPFLINGNNWLRCVYGSITAVNSPNCMNNEAREFLDPPYWKIDCPYDGGDIIHLWPLGYAKNPGLREFDHTRGLVAAHNNKPKSWEEFPI